MDQFGQVIDVHVAVRRDIAPAHRFLSAALVALDARLRPIRGLKTVRGASVEIRGHAFVQNTRCGHYELVAVI